MLFQDDGLCQDSLGSGFRSQCGRGEGRTGREALVPSRSRAVFTQQWSVRRRKTRTGEILV